MFEALTRCLSSTVPARDRATPFCPSRPQQAYLEAWLDPQAPKTVSGISAHINVPRRTIQNWLTRDTFVAWFNGEVERHTHHLWQPVLHKLASLALEGSIEHMKLLAQMRGGLRHPGGDVTAGITVIVGVPRPVRSGEHLDGRSRSEMPGDTSPAGEGCGPDDPASHLRQPVDSRHRN